MKKLILLLAVCFSFSTLSFSQNIQDSEQIIVKLFENSIKKKYSKILVTYGEGKTEEIQLEKPSSKNFFEGHSKNIETLNRVLLNIRKAGYEIITGTDTTYILVKKEG